MAIIYIRCIYGNFGREFTKYMVEYTVYIKGSGLPCNCNINDRISYARRSTPFDYSVFVSSAMLCTRCGGFVYICFTFARIFDRHIKGTCVLREPYRKDSSNIDVKTICACCTSFTITLYIGWKHTHAHTYMHTYSHIHTHTHTHTHTYVAIPTGKHRRQLLTPLDGSQGDGMNEPTLNPDRDQGGRGEVESLEALQHNFVLSMQVQAVK